MSRRDVRDMLGMEDEEGQEGQAAPPSQGKKKKSKVKEAESVVTPGKVVVGKLGKKSETNKSFSLFVFFFFFFFSFFFFLDRLSRDLKNLQAAKVKVEVEEASPVVPAFSGKMKKKAKSALKVVPWTRVQYASHDGPHPVMLSHVRPLDDPVRTVNSFLRMNKAYAFSRYSDAQYEKKLRSDEWTREETDHLMSLVELFEGRLIVVHDRWEAPWRPRTLEEIKQRFYETQRALGNTFGVESKQGFVFDVEGARLRKRHAEILYNRNGFEVWEEFEAKKAFEPVAAELAKCKVATGRARQLIHALEHGVRDYATAVAASSLPSAVKADKKKNAAWSPSDAKSKPKKKTSSFSGGIGLAGGLTTQLPAAVDGYLRNTLGVPIRPSAHPKAAAVHSELRNNVMVLLDLQVLLQQKQYERELLRLQLEQLQSGQHDEKDE